MSLQAEIISYFNAIRRDAKDPRRIDKLKDLVASYENIALDETRAYSKRVAGLIDLLFREMPELEQADPHYKKLSPLCDYCENLPKAKKSPKHNRP